MNIQPKRSKRTESHLPGGESVSPLSSELEQDDVFWKLFAEASTADMFCRQWLALQCTMISETKGGVVFFGPPDRGPFHPVASWPNSHAKLTHLTQIAQQTMAKRCELVVKSEPDTLGQRSIGGRYVVGSPIQVRGVLRGAIVLEAAFGSDERAHAVTRQLRVGAALLEVLSAGEALAEETATRARLQQALDLVASTLSEERSYAAALSFVTALATQLHCERASVGFRSGGRVRLYAMSHSAVFKSQTNLVRGVTEAMEEAIDQRATIILPAETSSSGSVTRAHEALAKGSGADAICTIPLEIAGEYIGALTLERSLDRPFDTETRELCQSVCAVVGPILDLHRRNDRWLVAKAWDAVRWYGTRLFGPRHVMAKLGTTLVTGLLVFCSLAQGEYRVSAKTVVEPVVQQAATVPFDSYIKEASARAGDAVRAGQLLCLLDDRQLRLEYLKTASRLEELWKQYHKAMADREAAKGEILTAQMKQVRAELGLLKDQLDLTQVTAPFDGIVVTGDLSQSLGAPVEKGKVLYEIAPLDRYRLVLEVDERDIADLAVGRSGTLLLAAFPDDALRLTVENVTPVSTARDGQNFFRVEARLNEPHTGLRPGMEGSGKIEIEPRRLIWIWTHQIVDWFRLAVWSWMP